MTEIIKTIIQELAKEPFKKKFTVISFDNLKPELLLQILNDVLTEIEPSNKIDIREEAVEDTVVRMLNMLRILKYKPSENDPSVLRSGLVDGNPNVVHPVLAWLLSRVNELKTRAYLARFLVKVDVPEEFRADIDFEELYQQYEELIETFKGTHKQLETMKTKGFTTSEIRKDIQAMESEEESVQRKIEKLKQRVSHSEISYFQPKANAFEMQLSLKTEGTANLDATLEVVRNYRKERENAKELSDQCVSQTQGLAMAEQRIQRLQRQLKEIRQAGIGATPEGILQRLEEDTNVIKFVVHEKLPQEIMTERKKVEVYEKILQEAVDGNDLEDKQAEIELLNKEVNEMVMKRMMKTEDDKLVMFRQQTAIVANKKSSLLGKIREVRNDLLQVKEDVAEKKEIAQKFRGDVSMNEDEFKEYVKALRVKSTRYKQMKAHLNFLKEESATLSKTLYILDQGLKSSELDLTATEARLGIPGYLDIQGNLEKVSSEKSSVDETKSKNLQQMSLAVQELHNRISMKKSDLAPLVKSLNTKRQSFQIISHEHEGRKRTFDGIVASVEAGLNRVGKEVENQRKKYEDEQLKYCTLTTETRKHEVDLQRMEEELKLYTVARKAAGGGHEAEKKSFKEKLLGKVGEQERLSKAMKDEEKELQVKQQERIYQAQLWRDVVRLLECKHDLGKNKGGSGRSGN